MTGVRWCYYLTYNRQEIGYDQTSGRYCVRLRHSGRPLFGLADEEDLREIGVDTLRLRGVAIIRFGDAEPLYEERVVWEKMVTHLLSFTAGYRALAADVLKTFSPGPFRNVDMIFPPYAMLRDAALTKAPQRYRGTNEVAYLLACRCALALLHCYGSRQWWGWYAC